jgi:gp16 family phage-associated protein
VSKVEQIKKELRRRGVTMSAWARANGHKPQDVFDVLRGRSQGTFGEGHVIAVKLGLKDGEIVTPDMLKAPLTTVAKSER